jgi:peptidoglycan hydrolase CwlO-like protein
MPQPNSKSLHAQIATLSAEVGMMRELTEEAGRNRKQAEAERDQMRSDAAELKRLLAEAREKNAELSGYIRAGHEMDDAASERVAIQVAPEPLVPRTRLARQNGEARHGATFGHLWDAFDRATPRHWTEIG